jgi:hypothetical protein
MMYVIGVVDQLRLSSIGHAHSDICWNTVKTYGMAIDDFKAYLASNPTRAERPGAQLVHEALRAAHPSCP